MCFHLSIRTSLIYHLPLKSLAIIFYITAYTSLWIHHNPLVYTCLDYHCLDHLSHLTFITPDNENRSSNGLAFLSTMFIDCIILLMLLTV